MSGQCEPLSPTARIGAVDSHPTKPLGTAQHCVSPDNQQLAEYLDRIAAGDRTGFEALYRLTAPRLWAVVRRMIARKQSAEDILQETYLAIWRKAHLFDPTVGEALGWMTTIARHRAIAWLRQPGNATRGPPVTGASDINAEAITEHQPEQEEARREERLRAIGRQLDEEAARREAASIADRQPNLLPLSLSNGRRVKLFGRTHPNVELIRYAEAWAQSFQFNTKVETIHEVGKRRHRDPLVTVAIRSDGSVESVTFELPSGVAEVDDAIRQIVERQKPYVAFPHALAREYDVVEIRRTWHFDTVIRLY